MPEDGDGARAIGEEIELPGDRRLSRSFPRGLRPKPPKAREAQRAFFFPGDWNGGSGRDAALWGTSHYEDIARVNLGPSRRDLSGRAK
jgi:hypothetical protein